MDVPDAERDLHFPAAGIDLSRSFTRQTPRDVGGGVYARTTPSGVNVRGYEATTERRRGGSRPGLSKHTNTPLVSGWVVQHLDVVAGSGYGPPGGGSAVSSQSGRVVTLVGVAQGNVYARLADGSGWSQAANATGEVPPLNFNGVMRSAVNNQRLWFADGINYAYYDPKTHTVYQWQASAGSLPVDSANNTPRLICTWRGRTVLSGLLLDPQNWFMSRVGDPTDWDYGPPSFSPAQPVAGNNAPQGLVGDVITALVPYTDDVLVFGGDHTVWMMRGDPLANGQIDLVSDAIGFAWGEAWCKDPYGAVYFLSNRTGVYRLYPGQGPPVRISQAVEELLVPIDTGTYGARMVWDDRFQGFHLFVTNLVAPTATTHFFWEQRTGAWWEDSFTDTNMDPLCATVYDGNLPTDRAVLIGCWDGFVRKIDPDAPDDDGVAIASSVVIGPLVTPTGDDLLLKELQAVLGETSGSVTWQALVGRDAEAALSSTAVASGTWTSGRRLTNLVRRSGHAVYVKLTSTTQWAMEFIRARVAGLGKVRRRGA